jgi:hypothetical protein
MSAKHGNTPAAWTGAALAMLGFVIGGIGLMVSPVSMMLFWVGAAVAVVSLPVFAIMAKMGMNS